MIPPFHLPPSKALSLVIPPNRLIRHHEENNEKTIINIMNKSNTNTASVVAPPRGITWQYHAARIMGIVLNRHASQAQHEWSLMQEYPWDTILIDEWSFCITFGDMPGMLGGAAVMMHKPHLYPIAFEWVRLEERPTESCAFCCAINPNVPNMQGKITVALA